MLRCARRLVLTVLGVALFGIPAARTVIPVTSLAPQAALASCIAPLPLAKALAQAPVVFVGTVLRTSNSDRTAVVRVEQVWHGPAISGEVQVLGGPEDGAAATSVDRTFQIGVTYLFVPTNTRAPFRDNACTSTQPYTSDLDRFRPTPNAPLARSYRSVSTVRGLRVTLLLPKATYKRGMLATVQVRVTNVSSTTMELYRNASPYGAVYVEVLNGAKKVVFPAATGRGATDHAPARVLRLMALRPHQTLVRSQSIVLLGSYLRPVVLTPDVQGHMLRGKVLALALQA